ncbi:MAG: hypothetical protein JWO72_2665 [Caulobacteraceae bacterium]|nr:hypothetical protein [Caulobacteraceae bacterium]
MKEPTLRHSLAAFPVLAALLLAAPALAAETPAPAPTAPAAPTPLTGVVVVPPSKEPPAVASTYPAAGAAVSPGTLVLKVTFNQRMKPEDWRFDRGADGYPQCLARPRLLPDEKTFVLLCSVGGNGKFSVQLNAAGPGGFSNLAGQRATPFELQFSTSEGASLGTIQEAMKAAGLKPEDDPVMDKRPATTLAASNP